MLRYFFAFVVLVHGLIHIMGFTKAFNLADIEQLTQDISRPAGLFWLAAGLLFILTVVLYLIQVDSWWIISLPAILISQSLIIMSWQDAKFGTIVNIIVLGVTVIALGQWSFKQVTMNTVREMLPDEIGQPNMITAETIQDLPPVVQRWLKQSNVVGNEQSVTVHLTQQGEMRTKPGGSWIPFTAEQWFTPVEPGFVWLANVRAAPGVHLSGRDVFMNGDGHMLIKLLSLVPVVNSVGDEINQGTLLRYLGEVNWFPSGALSEYIQWEQLDSTSVKATMTYKGVTDTGIFRFTEDGDLASYQAKRFYERKEGPTLEDWLIEMDPESFKEFQGVRIGTKSTVTWRLEEGDYTWLKLEITDIEYNQVTSKNIQ